MQHLPLLDLVEVNLDPDGNFLFVAGQGSGKLASYRIDSVTGILTPF